MVRSMMAGVAAVVRRAVFRIMSVASLVAMISRLSVVFFVAIAFFAAIAFFLKVLMGSSISLL